MGVSGLNLSIPPLGALIAEIEAEARQDAGGYLLIAGNPPSEAWLAAASAAALERVRDRFGLMQGSMADGLLKRHYEERFLRKVEP